MIQQQTILRLPTTPAQRNLCAFVYSAVQKEICQHWRVIASLKAAPGGVVKGDVVRAVVVRSAKGVRRKICTYIALMKMRLLSLRDKNPKGTRISTGRETSYKDL